MRSTAGLDDVNVPRSDFLDVLTRTSASAFAICYICINRSTIMFYYSRNHGYDFSLSSTSTQYIWSSSSALETTRSQVFSIEQSLSPLFFLKTSFDEQNYRNLFVTFLLVIFRFSNKRSHSTFQSFSLRHESLRQEAIMRSIESSESQISFRRFDTFAFDASTSTRDEFIAFDIETLALAKEKKKIYIQLVATKRFNLITTCVNHIEKYRKSNIMNFWKLVEKIFTIVSAREFASCRKRVENWCKKKMNQIVKKEMNFDTKKKISEFRNRLKLFVQRWTKIKKTHDFEQKSQKDKLHELRKNVFLQKQFCIDMQTRSNEDLNLIEDEKRISTFDIISFSNKQKRKRQKTADDKTKFKNLRESIKNLKTTMTDSLTAIGITLIEIVRIFKIVVNSRVDRLEKNVETLKMQSTKMLEFIKYFAQNTFKLM